MENLLAQSPCLPKISPIAAVPHKSQSYCMILDLSFHLISNTVSIPSINKTTDTSTTPLDSRDGLGWVLLRLIHVLASAPAGPAFHFAKLDIMNRYWRMVVLNKVAYNFAFVLPPTPHNDLDNPMIVITTSLPMGWTLSPTYFCVASEMGWDIAKKLTFTNIGSLP